MNENLIEIEGLRFGWPGAAAPLIGCDHFELRHGEHLFIRGPSGSGKSTLLNLLAGVLKPDAGRVQLMQQDIAALGAAGRDRFRADHIGFIFQQFNLVPYLGLVENVVLPCRFSARRAARTRDAGDSVEAGAGCLLEQLFVDDPLDPDTPVIKLSVGQQQRVAAARALIGRPEIIIADEPTSALDFETRTRFVDLLFEQVEASQATLVFVSHDPTLAEGFVRRIDIDSFLARRAA